MYGKDRAHRRRQLWRKDYICDSQGYNRSHEACHAKRRSKERPVQLRRAERAGHKESKLKTPEMAILAGCHCEEAFLFYADEAIPVFR